MKNDKIDVLTKSGVERFKSIAIVCWGVIGLAIIIIGLGYIINKIMFLLQPFIFAAVIVVFLKPLLEFFQKKGIPRIVSLTLTYLLFIAIFIILLFGIIPVLVNEGNQLAKNFPEYSQKIGKVVNDWQTKYRRFSISPEIRSKISQALEILKNYLLNWLSSVAGGLYSFFSVIFNLILAPLIAFFMLTRVGKGRVRFLDFIPEKYRERTVRLGNHVDNVIRGFFLGQLILAVIVAIVSAIVFSILKIPFAILLGAIGGFLYLIPYIGPVIALIPIAIAGFFVSPWAALIAVIVYIAITQISNLVIVPLIMKQQVDLEPATVIFVLLVGANFFGFWGLILGIPVAAIIKEIIYSFVEFEGV